MSRKDIIKKEVIAAGERVLGKMDSFPPVVFYLCKNGHGDICTPWAFSLGRGTGPRLNVSDEIAQKIVEAHNKNTGRGTGPRLEWTATQGYINIQLSDNYILQTINELAEEFQRELYGNIRPDNGKITFLQDFFIYLAAQEKDFLPIETLGKNDSLRRLGVLIIYADITGNVETLKEELYNFMRRGSVPRPALLRAAAQLFVKNRHKV